MVLSYSDVNLLIKSYDESNGDLDRVANDFLKINGRSIEHQSIIKVVSRVNDLMKARNQRLETIDTAIYELFNQTDARIAV